MNRTTTVRHLHGVIGTSTALVAIIDRANASGGTRLNDQPGDADAIAEYLRELTEHMEYVTSELIGAQP